MCNNRENGNCNNCIAEILHVINILQSNANPENCLNSCDRPTLGGGSNCVVCNTRPIMLFTCEGDPWKMPISKTNEDCDPGRTSCVFRVEKLEGCCCTCRVLAPNPDTTSLFPFVSTDSVFTIDINCVCAIRCLNDTHVECL